MKKIFVPILLIGLLVACKSKDKAAVKDTLSRPTVSNVNSAETQALIKKFKPILQGCWIKADYAEKVKNTKSLLEASDLATWITVFYINTDKIEGDSIKLIAGYGNHDSGDVTIAFRRGKAREAILFNGQDLNYSVKDGDTVLLLPQYDEQKKQYFETRFIRSEKKGPDNDLGYGLDRYINKNLFMGEYNVIDSAANSRQITFTENGEVKDFLNFKHYRINYDLNMEPNDNLDEIYFSNDKRKHLASYTFKIIADTLKLFDTHENADSTQLVLGKLKYKLVRQK
jgi:hypothetical protein